MIPKSGNRFSEKIMLQRKIWGVNRKSGNRFSEKIMLKQKARKAWRSNYSSSCSSRFSRLVSRLGFDPFSHLGSAHWCERTHGCAVFAPAFQTCGLDPRRDEVEL
jgi:hypothetical protein